MGRSMLHAEIMQHWTCRTQHTLRKGHQSDLWCAQIWIIITSDNDIKLTNEIEGSDKGRREGVEGTGTVSTVYVKGV